MTTARAIGGRVEDLSQRSDTERVFANPDGTWTSEGTTEPERVQDDSGEWQNVDTGLVEQAGGGYGPASALGDVVFSDGGDRTFAAMTDDRGKRIEFRWPTVLPVPTVEGGTATYSDALAGVGDLVVIATTTGFTHNIVIPAAPAEPVSVTIPVATKGADLNERPSGEVVIEADGTELATAPRPLMWDSSNPDTPQAASVDTTVATSSTGTPTLTLKPDTSFLDDPETVYPVTVDPSFTMHPSGDTWLQYPSHTSSQISSTELRAGTPDDGTYKARSYLRFDGGDARWDGLHVLDGDTSTYQLGNLHGDTVATQSHQSSTLTVDTYAETDEYGNTRGDTSPRYDWNGSHQRSRDTLGGLVLMGARLYNPSTGLFSSADPVTNGGANRYSYPTDSVNIHDLNGQRWIRYMERKTWYSSPYNFWNAKPRWYNYRGSKYLIHLTQAATRRLATQPGFLVGVLAIAIVGLLAARSPSLAVVASSGMTIQVEHFRETAKYALRKGRRMRITVYRYGLSATVSYRAWVD